MLPEEEITARLPWSLHLRLRLPIIAINAFMVAVVNWRGSASAFLLPLPPHSSPSVASRHARVFQSQKTPLRDGVSGRLWSPMTALRFSLEGPLGDEEYAEEDDEKGEGPNYIDFNQRRGEWLDQASDRLLLLCDHRGGRYGGGGDGGDDLFARGKWHEAVSLLKGWSAISKPDGRAPIRMETLLALLREDYHRAASSARAQSPAASAAGTSASAANDGGGPSPALSLPDVDWVDLHNEVLNAWACAALFETQQHHKQDESEADGDVVGTFPQRASQRAREILVLWQEQYEAAASSAGSADPGAAVASPAPLPEDYTAIGMGAPNEESFRVVFHVVCRVEGPVVARRLLAWMEYLTKSSKNTVAGPTRFQYNMMLNTYAAAAAASSSEQQQLGGIGIVTGTGGGVGVSPGALAEGFLRHMRAAGLCLPDTYSYNVAIKAWNGSCGGSRSNGGRKGGEGRMQTVSRREAAEHADRILEDMREAGVVPDQVTYGSVISAWAASGMRDHAAARAEELVGQMRSEPGLGEPNTVVWNAVMSCWVRSRNPVAVKRTLEILTFNVTRPDLVSYNTHLHALSLHATKRPELADRAAAILRSMEEAHDSGNVDFRPNLFSYNLVLEAYNRACSKDQQHHRRHHSRAGTGGQRLRQPEKNVAPPALRAARVLRDLISRSSPEVQPDSFSFHQVLSCLSKSTATLPDAARMAENLLRYQETAYRSGRFPLAPPDVYAYSSVIVAYSRSPRDPESIQRAERLLQQIKDRSAASDSMAGEDVDDDATIRANRICYNSLIDCWAKSGRGVAAARRAEALLEEMHELGSRGADGGGDPSVAPNVVTYNSVLNAWARSGTRCCARKAETYLDRMWELYRAGDERVKPNGFSYNTVINAISKSTDAGKAQKALRILRKMDKLYRATGDEGARPDEITYTAVLNSCAFPAVTADSRTKRKALDTAVFTLQELRSSRYGRPNQVTYGTFLKACANLVVSENESREVEDEVEKKKKKKTGGDGGGGTRRTAEDDYEGRRRAVLQETFEQCCEDGLVGDMVLTYLRQAAPSDLYEELMSDALSRQRRDWGDADDNGEGGDHRRSKRDEDESLQQQRQRRRPLFMVTVEDLPPEWRKNVQRSYRKRYTRRKKRSRGNNASARTRAKK